jgi:hypothetical protein
MAIMASAGTWFIAGKFVNGLQSGEYMKISAFYSFGSAAVIIPGIWLKI